MTIPIKVLLVEDNPDDCLLIQNHLEADPLTAFDITTVKRLADGLHALAGQRFEVVLLDLSLPDSLGLVTFQHLYNQYPQVPIVVLSGSSDEDLAVVAVRAGAQDYIVKDAANLSTLGRSLRYAAERHHVQLKLRESEARLKNFLDAVPDALVIVNKEGQLILANTQTERLFGYSQAELLGLPVDRLVPQRFRGQYQFYRADFLTNPKNKTVGVSREIYAVTRDGREFPAEISLSHQKVGGEVVVLSTIRDITERKQTEETLRAEQLRFAQVAATVPGVITTFHLRPDGVLCIPYASQAFEDIYGLTLANVAENINAISERIPAEQVATLVETVSESARTLQPWRNEYQYHHPVKGEVWLEGYSMPIQQADGSIIWHGITIDITERKQAEEALRESEEKYRSLIDSQDAVIATIDAEGVYHYMNHLGAAPLAGSPEGVVGRNLRDFFPSPSAESQLNGIRQVIATGQGLVSEYQTMLLDRPIWRRVSIQPVRNAAGQVTLATINSVDITERKQAEEALRKSEALLAEAQRIGHIGHWEWTASDSNLICSTELYRILEILPDSGPISRKTITALIHPEDWERLREVDVNTLANRADVNYEFRINLSGGRVRWLHQQAKVTYAEDGQPVRMIGIMQDITERKRGEIELSRNNAKFIALMENTQDQIWAVDTECRLIFGNTVFEQTMIAAFGQKLLPGESTIVDWLPAEMQLYWKSYYQRALAGEVFGIEIDTQLSKQQHTVDFRFSPIYAEDKTIMGVVVAGRDVTERKRVEIALRLSEEQYRGLVESLDSVIITVDAEGRFLYMNDVAASQLGGTVEALIGKYLPELFPEPIATRQMASIRRAIQEDKRLVLESQSVIQGQPRWYRTMIQPIHDEMGRAIHALINSTDIHDLKTAQQELQELNRTLEERVRQRTAEVQDLYDNAPTGYHSLDAAGNFVMVNQTELNWLGYTCAEVVGRPLSYFMTPASQATFRASFPAFIQRGWVKDLEYEFIRKDGSIFAALLNGTAIYDEQGNFVMSRSTVFDNTERKKTETALKESEERFHLMFEKHNAAMLLVEPDSGRIIDANTAAQNFYGYPMAALQEMYIYDINVLPPEKVIQQFQQAGHEALNYFVFPHRLANGEIRTVEVHSSPIVVNRKPILFSIIHDISERIRSENALRESEEQNRLLFEESPDAVVLFDADGRVVQANRTAEMFTSWTREQLIGCRWDELGLVFGEQQDRVGAAVAQAMQSIGSFAATDFKLKQANGKIRDVGARIFGLKIQGRQHYLSAMRDITAEKQVEETLRRANAELERAARAKDEFLATMSHELRTPLNAILGLSEALLEEVRGPLNERQQDSLRHIESSGQHLLALINDILDLSKVEAGRMELQFETVPVADVCQASLRFVREMALKKQQQLSFTTNNQLAKIETDAKRLKQMLVNLLSNAVKFTPAGGQVSLDVTADAPAGVIRLAVHDNGIGISPEDKDRLFQPFMQLDSSLSRQYEGTGLGLALVRRLAELHGGSVTVESEPGQGSRFTILLPYRLPPVVETKAPVAAVTEPATAPAAENSESAAGERILLVEDQETNIQTTCNYLQVKGYQIIVARNGQEAVSIAESSRPDLILMDIQMPEMDGLEAIRRLRANPEFAGTPIIALTALAMPGDEDRCLQAGANQYLSKPISLKKLVATIKELLKQ